MHNINNETVISVDVDCIEPVGTKLIQRRWRRRSIKIKGTTDGSDEQVNRRQQGIESTCIGICEDQFLMDVIEMRFRCRSRWLSL